MTFYLFLLANVNEAFLPLFASMNKAQKDIWEIEFVLGIVLVCQMEIDSASFRLPFILEQPLNLWLF